MPTSDERREVAWRLRSEVSEGECIDFAVFRIAHDVLGVEDATGARAARILADLIDPTCHVVSEALHTGSFGCEEAGTEFTLSCGHTVIVDGDFHPGYCDECGARVVDDE